MQAVPDVNLRNKNSMQSKINSGPNETINMILYNNLLDYTGWTIANLNDIQINTGNQIRFIVKDERRGGNKYCSGGFLLVIEDEYLLYRSYAGYRWTVQKSNLVELWYRSPKGRGKNKKKKQQ